MGLLRHAPAISLLQIWGQGAWDLLPLGIGSVDPSPLQHCWLHISSLSRQLWLLHPIHHFTSHNGSRRLWPSWQFTDSTVLSVLLESTSASQMFFGQLSPAEHVFHWWQDPFGKHFWLEIQTSFTPILTWNINSGTLANCDKLGVGIRCQKGTASGLADQRILLGWTDPPGTSPSLLAAVVVQVSWEMVAICKTCNIYSIWILIRFTLEHETCHLEWRNSRYTFEPCEVMQYTGVYRHKYLWLNFHYKLFWSFPETQSIRALKSFFELEHKIPSKTQQRLMFVIALAFILAIKFGPVPITTCGLDENYIWKKTKELWIRRLIDSSGGEQLVFIGLDLKNEICCLGWHNPRSPFNPCEDMQYSTLSACQCNP